MRNKNRIETLIGNQTDSEDAFCIIPEWGNYKGSSSIRQPMLSNAEMKGFERYCQYKLITKVSREIRARMPNIARDIWAE